MYFNFICIPHLSQRFRTEIYNFPEKTWDRNLEMKERWKTQNGTLSGWHEMTSVIINNYSSLTVYNVVKNETVLLLKKSIFCCKTIRSCRPKKKTHGYPFYVAPSTVISCIFILSMWVHFQQQWVRTQTKHRASGWIRQVWREEMFRISVVSGIECGTQQKKKWKRKRQNRLLSILHPYT